VIHKENRWVKMHMNPKGMTQNDKASAEITLAEGTIVDDLIPQTIQSTTGSQSEAALSIRKPYRIVIRGLKVDDKNNPT